jgi:hypothetical protein
MTRLHGDPVAGVGGDRALEEATAVLGLLVFMSAST